MLMNKIKKIILFLLVGLSAINIVNAFYFSNYNDMFDAMGMHGFGFFVGLGIFAVLIAAFLFVFWLWMLIDCLKRDFKKDYEKIAWILVMIFLHLLGAIIYYFVVKISEKNKNDKKK